MQEILQDVSEQLLASIMVPVITYNIIDISKILRDGYIIGNKEWDKNPIKQFICLINDEIIVIPGNSPWNPTLKDLTSNKYYKK